MSFTLQTQHLVEPDLFPASVPEVDPLTQETGWGDVATGLTRVLIGYLLSFVCLCLAVALLVWLGLQAASGALADPEKALDASTLLLVGGGIIGVMSLVGYGLVLVGKWACALHAPERKGARWLIFATITCMVIGPALNIIAGISGANEEDPPAKAARADARQQSPVPDALTRAPTTIQLAATGVSLATTLFFVLFLRAVGLCFGYEAYGRMTELYLCFTALLLAFTFYLLYSVDPREIPALLVIGLGAAWLASLLGYVALVIGARIIVGVGLERLQASRLV